MSQRPPVKNLDALSDVTLSSPTNLQSLVYQSATSDWRNSAVPNSALSTLTDVTLTAPADGALLRYDGASSKWIDYGPLAFSDLDPSSNIDVTQINDGTNASSTTFHRGDGTWASAVTADPGSAGNVMTSDGASWISAPATGSPAKITWLTSGSSTYTVTTGCRALYVECWGAGGQGGGAATASSTCAVGAGGGAGAYAALAISGPAATYSYAVGAGGSGATAGLPGNGGGDTTWGSTLCVAKGGGGGPAGAAAATFGSGNGGAGGLYTSCTGDVKIQGGAGGSGIRLSGTQGWSGYGASSAWGSGPWSLAAVTGGVIGFATNVPGTGGSGAATLSTAQAGGAGGPGLIKITEFF